MTQQFSHAEWALNLALKIDAAHPGFCGGFLRASSERRQVIAAYLSTGVVGAEQWSEVAELLLKATHDTILTAAFGMQIRGMRGALRRAGPTVHEQRFYSVLHKLLSRPRHGEIVNCIRHLETLDLMKLRVLNILPQPICRPNVVEAIPNVQTASDLIVAMKLLVSSGADETQLAAAVRAAQDERSLAKIMKRALLKCRAPDHPVPETPTYRPIRSARELHQIAARYRNCTRNYIVELLDPESGHAFAEVRDGPEGAVVHLRRTEHGWRCEGVFGRSNLAPHPALRDAAHSYLAQHGIHEPKRGRAKTAWEPVRRIASTARFEFDL